MICIPFIGPWLAVPFLIAAAIASSGNANT